MRFSFAIGIIHDFSLEGKTLTLIGLSEEYASWHDSLALCKEQGGTLATIKTKFEMKTIQREMEEA